MATDWQGDRYGKQTVRACGGCPGCRLKGRKPGDCDWLWYADYYADGQRVQESTGTANKREAEKVLALRISEVQRGVFVKPVNITLADFGERYIEYAKTHKRSWKRDVQMLVLTCVN
ncbi:MAG TPA: hypothetical protein VIX89_07130 [Bryobacteraceae bacterium]